MIEPKISYIVLSSSQFAIDIVTNYISFVNQLHGVVFGNSIHGYHLVLSKVANPTKHRVVISEKRDNTEGFVVINVDDNWIKLLALMDNVTNQDFVKYANRLNGSLEEKYYWFKLILETCIIKGEFLKTRADSIMNDEYKLKYSVRDKLNALINMVNLFNLASWLKFVQIVNEEDYGLIISFLEQVVNGEIAEVNLNNTQSMRSALNVSVASLKTNNFFDFQLELMKSVR